MKTLHGLQRHAATVAPPGPNGPAMPVLIEVPALRTVRVRPGHTHGRPCPRPRRRLRREVRVAGYALLTALPVTVLSLSLLSARPSALFGSVQAVSAEAIRADATPTAHPALISISIEPIGSAGPLQPEPPVVLPGYLLPDDGPEEPGHAGG